MGGVNAKGSWVKAKASALMPRLLEADAMIVDGSVASTAEAAVVSDPSDVCT